MTTTPWPSHMWPSREIYSGDIAGLQSAVTKIETALGGMGIEPIVDVPLYDISDQADSALHRRIYHDRWRRGWLRNPAPIIKRNGVVVSPIEYTIYEGNGFIVFNAQQASNAAITVTATTTIDKALGLERLPFAQNIRAHPTFQSPSTTGHVHVDVMLPANTQMLLPYINPRDILIHQCAVHIVSGVSGWIWGAIYSDNGNIYPGGVWWRSSGASTSNVGMQILPVTEVIGDPRLPAGLYWFMVHSSVDVVMRGVQIVSLPSLGVSVSDLGPAQFVGYMRSATAGLPPSTFPDGAGLHRVVSGTLAIPTLYMRRQ